MTGSNGPFRILSSTPIYENPWLRLEEDHVLRPGGEPARFGVVRLKAGASVLAMDGNDDVYLVREFKYALRAETLELVSGAVDDGETPLEAAQRELQEEAGLAAARWISLGRLDPLSSIVEAPIHLFLALDLSPVTAGGDEGGLLSVLKLPFAGARELALCGEITHAATIAALFKAAAWLERSREISR
jgi:ADP-ribose pyrophosphatase